MVPGYIIYDSIDQTGYYFVEDATSDSTSYDSTSYYNLRRSVTGRWPSSIWLDEEQKEILRRQAFNNFLDVIRYRYAKLMLWKYVPVKSKYIMIPTNSMLQRWDK